MKFSLSGAPLDTAALEGEMRGPAAGALVTFHGWVRDRNEGRGVTALEYEAYAPLAQAEGERIALEAEKAFEVESVRCVHRVGRLAVGEAAVWVGVTAAHRDAAFRACRYVIDEVKERVPIWKKEHYVDGSSEWTAPAREEQSAAPR
jgi:molybdopterin synthase catalytic subunit